jgi:hypothetical protein
MNPLHILSSSLLGNLEEGLSSGEFERWMKWSLGMNVSLSLSLSLMRLRGGGFGWGGGAPSLGTLEDMLRKAPDRGISLNRGPFTTEGNLVGGGL